MGGTPGGANYDTAPMHVAILAHALPQPSSNGGPMTCWALLRHLRDAGHEVSVISLRYASDPFVTPEREDQIRATGARLVIVEVEAEADLQRPAGAVSQSTLERVFPTAHLRPRVGAVLEELAPDAAFIYHWDTLAATYGLRSVPRFGAVGDPWHLPNLRRWQHTRPSPTRAYVAWTFATLRGIRPSTRAMVEILNDCDDAAVFQAETADTLRRKGARNAPYLRPPILDGGGPDWESRRTDGRGARPRILLGPSHLGATSTRAGLQLFGKEILPALDRALGRDGFEVRVVGEGEPPPELAARLPHPGVTLTGRIEPADEEFLAADVQLIPTPFTLGQRVRIIVGWSFGCCVVTHESERANLPELADGENALLGRDGASVAAAIVRAARDGELRRRIGRGGRDTYERLFRPDVAARVIEERLARLARHDS